MINYTINGERVWTLKQLAEISLIDIDALRQRAKKLKTGRHIGHSKVYTEAEAKELTKAVQRKKKVVVEDRAVSK